MIIGMSSFFGNQTVSVDPYGLNPLADDLKAASPTSFQIASRTCPPPKMFTGGTADLPAFTASGADPRTLLKLPAYVRHQAAILTSMGQLLALLEAETDPTDRAGSPGLEDAVARMRMWGEGRWMPAQQAAAAADAAAVARAQADDANYLALGGESLPDRITRTDRARTTITNSTLTAGEVRARARARIQARQTTQESAR